jgi:hypothetical protein
MSTLKSFGAAGAAAALVILGNLAGCTTDDEDPGAGTGGSGATGGSKATGGGSSTGGSGTGGGSTVGSVCASPLTLPAGTKGIADFETYNGSDLSAWNFPLGGDSALGIIAGPFGYGDRDTGKPETFEMAEGNESKYALRIDDTLAEKYGGGMGLWLSACLNATKFTGITFWARGSSPTGKGTFTLSMAETLPITPSTPTGPVGLCAGDMETCKHPSFKFDLTDTWAKIEVPWSALTPGSAAGKTVTADGHNVTQFQFAVELNWAPDAMGVYVPTPAPYELAIDTVTFY